MNCFLFRKAGNRISRFSLREKALLITASVLMSLVILGGIGVDSLIRRSFARLENDWIKESAQRVHQLIDLEAEGLRRITYDYSVWSDTYNFIMHPDAAYLKSNFSIDVFKNLQLYGAFLYSTDGTRKAGVTVTADEKNIENADPDWDILLGGLARNITKGENKTITGLIGYKGKVYIVSCHEVLKDAGQGPPGGSFIHLRFFNQALLDRISAIAGFKINVMEIFAEADVKNFSHGRGGEYFFKGNGDDVVKLIIPFHDIEKKTVTAGVTMLDRKIHREGGRARSLFYILLAFIVFVAGFLNQFLLKKLVIFRLEKMLGGVKDVGETLDLSKRLDMRERDELDELAGGINRMLDSLEDEKTRRDQAEQEKELMQEYMLQAKKMEAMGTMAGGIAHDFNNMLVIILGSAELLRTDLNPGDPVLEHVESIEKAGQNASALVRRMMTINKGYSASRIYFSVGRSISDMLSLIKANLPGNISINLHNKIPDDLIYADIAQFQQVIINLVTNSAHAMAGKIKGDLDISISEIILPAADCRMEAVSLPDGRYLKVEFSDTGNGIPPDIRERIFEPFFSTKPIGSGTGLGLAVVHGFVVNNGGSIGVESESGKGTKFIIHLPAVVEKRKPVVHAEGKYVHILVVDDDSLVRKTIAAGLKRMGHKIYEAASGISALRILEECGEKINLVITDQMMPGMNGYELSNKIAAINPVLPIVLISGYISDEDTAIESSNFVKILMKPVSLAELESIISEILQRGPHSAGAGGD
jgi:signal transduction histidine kinase/CheY-like chemotaxis protein